MLIIERILNAFNEGYEARNPTISGQRSKGWEIPPKGPGDSDIIMIRGEADGSHVTVRLPTHQIFPERVQRVEG